MGYPATVSSIQHGNNSDDEISTTYSYIRNNQTGLVNACTTKRENSIVKKDLYNYNASGQVIHHAVVLRNTTDTLFTSYVYNSKGQLTTEIDPMGYRTSYTYTPYGKVQSKTDHLGITTNYTYDAMLRQTKESTPVSEIKTTYGTGGYGINTAYSITTETAGYPTETIYYDAFDRKVADGQKRFNGNMLYTDYFYHTNGKLGFGSFPHTGNNPSSEGTYYTYDAGGRIIGTSDTNGRTTSKDYDEYVDETIVDGISKTTTYASREKPGDIEDNSGYVSYEYNPEGKLEYAYHNGKEMTLSYDVYGNLTECTDMNGVEYSYGYGNNGYLNEYREGNGKKCFSKDKYGRILQKTFYENNNEVMRTAYRYNGKNQLVCDSSAHYVYHYDYDNYGRISHETRSISTTSTESVENWFEYDSTGQITKKRIHLDSINDTLTESYTYNNGWCTAIRINGILVWQLTSESNRGMIHTATDFMNTITTTYDDYGRLLSQSANGSAPFSQTYTYNVQTGNMMSKNGVNYSYDNMNRLTAWNGYNITYDNEGNILSMPNLGNIAYSGFRMGVVTNVDTCGINTKRMEVDYLYSLKRPKEIRENYNKLQFGYNGDGERIWMRFYQRPIIGNNYSSNVTETRYYLSDDCEVLDKGNNGKKYFYYVGGNAYDAKAVVLIENGTCKIYQMYRDNVGSVIMYAKNADITRISYTPFGTRMASNNGIVSPGHIASMKFLRGYTGHEEIPWFGLLNANARLYNPYIGRFLSPDPQVTTIGNPLDFNPYVYANNNPFKYVDRNGECPFLAITAIGNAMANMFVHGFNFKHYSWGKTEKAWKIDKGMLQGNLIQILGKWTWELPQSILGNVLAHSYNMLSDIEVDSNYGIVTIAGATGSSDNNRAVTIGHYSMGPNNYYPKFTDNMFVHEYGHYIQSQYFGPLYLVCIGGPSLFGTTNNKEYKHRWFEVNANVLAAKYFDTKYGKNSLWAQKHPNEASFEREVFTNSVNEHNYYNPRTHKKNQQENTNGIHIKFWDFIPFL